MALPLSSLSRICRSVADFLGAELEANSNSIRVLLGNPADAAKDHETEHRVNLFFYQVEPSGFGAFAPDEAWLVRLHCLITAFGVAENQVSSGENDLRLLGAVLRVFHENPILPAYDLDGTAVRAQVVFNPLTLDQINHIWSTQGGDVAFRPSVAYEMALAPIPPSELRVPGPLVGSIGVDVFKDLKPHPFGGNPAIPAVIVRAVSTDRPDWTPRLCLVDGGECAESLSFEVGSPELTAFTPHAWVAGLSGSPVTLRWESWEAGTGWTSLSDHVDTQATSIAIDPAAAGSATTVAAPMPFKDKAGQLVLYAVRSANRFPDGLAIEVRSNPVLINLYEGA
ncbi:MAG TPA: DUF4255 domain-containing protein [Thermoanaerobaculia bacterium]|jgi:hypothetical protein|nr:DUF4255 domain-containing protein [Thermoanaerobaculia bacterium]